MGGIGRVDGHGSTGGKKRAGIKAADPWWTPLTLSDAPLPVSSMFARAGRPGSSSASRRLRDPLLGAGAALTRGNSVPSLLAGTPKSMGQMGSDPFPGQGFKTSKSGESFFELLADSKKTAKAMHSDPFDQRGPNILFAGMPKKEKRPLELSRSLNVGDTLCGFTRGCRAAFKSSGSLVTVLGAGATMGMLEVQLDPEDIDAEGEIVAVGADSLMMPTREELLALEVRKHKTDA